MVGVHSREKPFVMPVSAITLIAQPIVQTEIAMLPKFDSLRSYSITGPVFRPRNCT